MFRFPIECIFVQRISRIVFVPWGQVSECFGNCAVRLFRFDSELTRSRVEQIFGKRLMEHANMFHIRSRCASGHETPEINQDVVNRR